MEGSSNILQPINHVESNNYAHAAAEIRREYVKYKNMCFALEMEESWNNGLINNAFILLRRCIVYCIKII